MSNKKIIKLSELLRAKGQVCHEESKQAGNDIIKMNMQMQSLIYYEISAMLSKVLEVED